MQSLSKKDIKEILKKRFENDNFISGKNLPHPFSLKDSQKAARIIIESMRLNKKILIVGDYDVDGIAASVLMMRFFEMINYANVDFIIPDRFKDGYGISPSILSRYDDIDVVITVDNGVSAFECGEYCKAKGIIFIITDHHSIKDLPLADAIINPQQIDCSFPQKEICGGAVAWYLCNAIKVEMELDLSLVELLDLVCIATIADMMPLVKINKLLVRMGIKKILDSRLIPNIIFKQNVKNEINAQDIGFYIAPLINSSGRMGNAMLGAKFLLSKNYQEASYLYGELQKLNQERKTTAKEIFNVSKDHLLVCKNALIAYGENWHEGVLGIVATQLAQAYKKPAFVFSKKDNILKGSARSYDKVNLISLLEMIQNLFDRFGGHTKAVGMQMKYENLEIFFDFLKTCTLPILKENDDFDEILGELEIENIDAELLKILKEFEPYGNGNPLPNFMCNNIKISSVKTIKSLHQQLEFLTKKQRQKAIVFFSEKFYQPNDYVNVKFSLQEDNYTSKPVMIIKDICPS